MARRAMRQDDNHGAVVQALRARGATVRTISQGDGLPDLLVGYTSPSGYKITVLIEISHVYSVVVVSVCVQLIYKKRPC